MPCRLSQDTPPEYPAQDLDERYRVLVIYLLIAGNQGLDSEPREAFSIWAEAVSVGQGALAELVAQADRRAT